MQVHAMKMRKQVHKAKTTQSLDIFTSDVGLELELFGRRAELDEIGDIDNMLGGVCDGLSKRRRGNPNIKPSWQDSKRMRIVTQMFRFYMMMIESYCP